MSKIFTWRDAGVSFVGGAINFGNSADDNINFGANGNTFQVGSVINFGGASSGGILTFSPTDVVITGIIGDPLAVSATSQLSLSSQEQEMLRNNPVSMLQPLITAASPNRNKLKAILSTTEEDGELIFKVNTVLDAEGNRLIDLICKDTPKNIQPLIIKTLRENGAVEPQTPIAVGNSFDKLIINPDEAPDSTPGNKEKATKIYVKLNQKFNLLEDDLDRLIEDFKKLDDFSTYKAEWGTLEQIDTVAKVIDMLASMRSVTDRLPMPWDFKLVLGALIHLSQDNPEMQSKLIDTLGQIKMCDLSKLMSLLYVGQDEILESTAIDYTKTDINHFERTVGASLDKVYDCFKHQAGLALIKWLNDTAYARDTAPENWCSSTQVLHGIFNSSFMQNPEVDINSYHFIDGLQNIVIKGLTDIMGFSAQEPKNELHCLWYNLVREGATQLAEEYFKKLVAGEADLSALENVTCDIALAFGQLEFLSPEMINQYYQEISHVSGNKMGLSFLRYLSEYCGLNDGATEYINHTISEHEVPLQGATDSYYEGV